MKQNLKLVKKAKQAGVTLVELLVTVAVIGVLIGTATYIYRNNDSVRATALASQMSGFRNALTMVRSETGGCIPLKLAALSVPTEGNTSSCGTSLVPKLQRAKYNVTASYDTSGNVPAPRFGDNAVIQVFNAGTVAAPVYVLRANDIQAEIADLVVEECNGGTGSLASTPCVKVVASGITSVNMSLPL